MYCIWVFWFHWHLSKHADVIAWTFWCHIWFQRHAISDFIAHNYVWFLIALHLDIWFQLQWIHDFIAFWFLSWFFFNACHCIGCQISLHNTSDFKCNILFNAWRYLISFNGLDDFVAFYMISVPVNMSIWFHWIWFYCMGFLLTPCHCIGCLISLHVTSDFKCKYMISMHMAV